MPNKGEGRRKIGTESVPEIHKNVSSKYETMHSCFVHIFVYIPAHACLKLQIQEEIAGEPHMLASDCVCVCVRACVRACVCMCVLGLGYIKKEEHIHKHRSVGGSCQRHCAQLPRHQNRSNPNATETNTPVYLQVAEYKHADLILVIRGVPYLSS